MFFCERRRLLVFLPILATLLIVMLACGTSTPPAPTPESTPDATIPEITVLPEPGEVPGDYLWVGSSDRIDDLLISFCV